MKSKAKSLPAFVWDNFRLQGRDFLSYPLIVCGGWTVVMALLAIIAAVAGDSDIFGVGIPGVLAVAFAVLLAFVQAYSRIWLEFKIGVQLSVPRRRMLTAEIMLSLATAVVCLAAAWLLDGLWLWAARAMGVQVEPLLSHMPLWGWGLALLLPVALGSAGGAIVLRFGSKGGWVLYGIFMVCMLCLGEGIDRIETAFEMQIPWAQLLVTALPYLGFALAAAALSAAVVLLWRVPVND